MNEKDCFDDFIAGFGFGVGREPWAASRRPSFWLQFSQLTVEGERLVLPGRIKKTLNTGFLE